MLRLDTMATRTLHMSPVDYLTGHHAVSLPLPSPSSRHFHSSVSTVAVEETHKGQWTPHEDEILRKCAQRRNANPTACNASRCRGECAECVCVHYYCSPDACMHGQCTERECQRPDSIYSWQRPVGSLVMRPLSDTLCRHLTSTDKPWTEIASEVSQQTGPGKKRNAKQCRERWFQQLRPGLLHQPITEEEGALIMELVERYGNKWADISRDSKLERRSDNWIKNWFNSSGNKKERAKHGMARGGGSSLRQSPGSPHGISRPRPHSQHQHHHHHHHQQSNSRSPAAVSQLFAYASESNTRYLPTRSPQSPPYLHSPSYQPGAYPFPVENSPTLPQPQPQQQQQSSSCAIYDNWDSTGYPTYSQPVEYHSRRRESTLSVNTISSAAANGSGPSTPSTSVSLTFPGARDAKLAASATASSSSSSSSSSPPTAHKPVGGISPRDPRMAIGALCGSS